VTTRNIVFYMNPVSKGGAH